MRVGLCEDDPAIRRVVTEGLRLHGHDTVTAYDGAEALRRFVDDTIDVLLIDIGLPDSDGRDVCVALRSAGQVAPAMFLTALDQRHEKLAGFAAGADDYVTKPFDLAELIARIEVVARRGRTPTAAAPTDLLLDPARHALVCRDCEVPLTPTEFRFLAAVTSRPGEVVRRRAVIAAAWPDGAIVQENTVDSYATRLRRKLARVDSPLQLRTVRGVGFELR